MASGSSERLLQKQTVFKSGDKVYRIPALFYERESKTFLAFAEQRKTTDDADSEKLVMKTGKVKTDASEGMIIEWSVLPKPVDEAHIKGHRTMNPCPLYEKTSTTLFLFFICVKGTVSEGQQLCKCENKARLCYITSTDVGQTWSGVTDLTDELPEIRSWGTFAVGPGHGIQTESGRLVVPVYGYAFGSCCSFCCSSSCKFWHSFCCIFCCKSWCHIPYALYLYSDDKGIKWQFSDRIEKLSLECEMAEVTNDSGSKFIYCNARSIGGYRVEAVSSDGTACFTVLTPVKLVETGGGCQGSVVSFPTQSEGAPATRGQDQSPNKWLLYSHPSSRSNRIDLGVFLNRSPSDSNAWSKPWIINSGPSGYSDLAYIDDGCFACLMERGEATETEEIASAVFSYSDVKQGIGE